MQSHLAELLEWYRGEIAGEAFFSTLAQSAVDPDRSHKWRLLARLEHFVAGQLRSALTARDVLIPTVGMDLQRGVESAQPYADLTWHEALARLRPELEGYVRDFQAAESRMPEDLLPLARFVTEHERALLEFVTLEPGEDTHHSLDSVLGLLNDRPRT